MMTQLKQSFIKLAILFFASNFVVKTNFHQFSHIFSKLKITYPTISITYLRMGGLKDYSCIYLYDDDDDDGNMKHYQ